MGASSDALLALRRSIRKDDIDETKDAVYSSMHPFSPSICHFRVHYVRNPTCKITGLNKYNVMILNNLMAIRRAGISLVQKLQE